MHRQTEVRMKLQVRHILEILHYSSHFLALDLFIGVFKPRGVVRLTSSLSLVRIAHQIQ